MASMVALVRQTSEITSGTPHESPRHRALHVHAAAEAEAKSPRNGIVAAADAFEEIQLHVKTPTASPRHPVPHVCDHDGGDESRGARDCACACGLGLCAAGVADVGEAAAAAKVNGGGGHDMNGGSLEVDVKNAASPENGGGEARPERPLLRTKGMPWAIIWPYRILIFVRLAAFALFVKWRIEHVNHAAMWLWAMSIAGELWLGFSWLIDQLPKLVPVHRIPDIAALNERYDSATPSSLPGLDVFVTTADPEKEPVLATANTIISILAVDYPVDRLTCYLSDDGGALVTYEAMIEAANFAALWVPFCRKHGIELRSPESYFELKTHPYKGTAWDDFVADRRRVRREFLEFKVRIDGLPAAIRRRCDTLNGIKGEDGDPAKQRPTWTADGTHWPGTWLNRAPNHGKGDHDGIVKVIVKAASPEGQLGGPAAGGGDDARGMVDFGSVDVRLPKLVYVSREKRPGYYHNKKAGAMNALVRASALLSNSPFILNLDCDHYVNNCQAFRAGICTMLGGGDSVAFVQFPQRFEGVDPTDRYANHNRIFFDGTLCALDGLQGPIYVGTGCLFRRIPMYGFEPPRPSARNGQGQGELSPSPSKKKFGKSDAFIGSISTAVYPSCANVKSADHLADGEEADTISEAVSLIASSYEDKTEWGRDAGWIYNTVTEDVVTGYRMHIAGWRSMCCSTQPHAFIGTAPINMTERLFQVLRWSTGSLEIFFSRNNPFLGGRRLHPLMRVAYLNITTYPFTSLFLIFYCFVPAISIITGQFIVQRPTLTFYVYLAVVLGLMLVLATLEVMWAGATVFEWFRNGQFWMIASSSAYMAAVLQVLLKLVGRRQISFNLTAKQAGAELIKDKYAELHIVRWTWLMIPPFAVIMVNLAAVGVAFGKVLNGEWTHWAKAVGCVFFNCWVLFHLYPFAQGLLGRRGKTPFAILVWWAATFVVSALLYVMLRVPPRGVGFGNN